MLSQNLLLKYIFYYPFFVICFLHTSYGKQNPYNCSPSVCGHIRNISYPFRLRDDPKHCDSSKFELSCENNTTLILLFDSQKYVVQAITYENYTIRLTDPSVNEHDRCSFPKHYVTRRTNFGFDYPYNSMFPYMTWSITFMSCPYPAFSNSTLLVETTKDCFNQSGNYAGHTYIKFGGWNGLYVMNMCRIDLQAITSFQVKNESNVSLSEIHSSLLYGFELSFGDKWKQAPCQIMCYCRFPKNLIRVPYDCWPYSSCSKQVEVLFYALNWIINVFPDPGDAFQGPEDSFTVFNWIIQLLPLCAVEGVALTLALRILIGMPSMLGLLIYKLRRRRYSSMFDVIEDFLQSNNNLTPIRYSYSDLKKMTRGFREKLGEGGYGFVYKGKLRSGHDVAVKVLRKSRANGQDFINEVATIGRIHHVNVVKLVGYCAEGSKRALVYDFMTNGSLDKYIFNRERANSLSWERKYEIAVGVARGIEYLHQGCNIQILHFDIKPHNILLDDNFTPKISDFGLAKFYSVENNTVTLTAARGTIGYVAPELINRSIGRVSYKADIYSFGMLLMEMVGLKDMVAADDDESSKYFPYWIYDQFNKGKEIKIRNASEHDDDDDDDDDEYARRISRKMTIVGLWCIQMSPSDRPSMGKVLKMFEGNGDLQIPPLQHSQSSQTAQSNAEYWETESIDSMALLGDDASIDE